MYELWRWGILNCEKNCENKLCELRHAIIFVYVFDTDIQYVKI